MKKYLFNTLLISTLLVFFSSYTFADCPSNIKQPKNKDIHVAYTVGHYYKGSFDKAWTDAGCKESSTRYWAVPHEGGKACAYPRVDGCSMKQENIDFGKAFTSRDKKLMTPSCNQHDLCYNTTGSGITKKICDDRFKENLLSTYRKFHGTYSTETVYQAVKQYGKTSYNNGQIWAKKHSCYNR